MNKKNDIILKITVPEIKKHLRVKMVKGKPYYYFRLKIDTPFDPKLDKWTKDYYLCPVDLPDQRMQLLFYNTIFKGLVDILKNQKNIKYPYRTDFLSKDIIAHLERLRALYLFFLKLYSESEIKSYIEKEFTRYVFGTTSVEGNTYTLRDIDLTLNEGVTVGGKSIKEFYEIENYKEVRDYVNSLKKVEISLTLIKKLHSLIMNKIDTQGAGEFRRIDVGIGGADFLPSPHILIEDDLEELIEWYYSQQSSRHPVELATLFHQKFEEIHPFTDGNGRTGRELLRMMLSQSGYPSIYIDNNTRENYLKALDSGNDGNKKELCEFIAKNIIDAHNPLISSLDRDINSLRKIVSKRLQQNPEKN